MSTNQTSIKKIKCIDSTEGTNDTSVLSDENNLPSVIMDLSISLKIRITALELHHDKFGTEETTELITKLGMMYTLSGTTLIKDFLYSICTESKIPTTLRLMSAKSLCFFNEKAELGYKALDYICQDLSNIPTPVKIDAVSILIKCPIDKYHIKARNYFCKIINDIKLECDYRYKTILSLENITENIYFIREACLAFVNEEKNMTSYKILASQCLLQKCKMEEKDIINTEETLLSFAQDNDLDYNLRADAADVLLQLGSKDNKTIARDIIILLGRQQGNVRTIFDNAQNVHTIDIEESVTKIITFLSSFPMMTLGKIPITWDYIKKQIEDLTEVYYKIPETKETAKEATKEDEKEKIKDIEDTIEKINVSLNRIYMDRALYSTYNCTIMHILMKIWSYMHKHEHETEMKKRLIQELIDMSGTCSTGFVSRLVNTITGFGEFTLEISWRDQIIANFTGRLNARANKIDDLNFQEQVLNEMMVSCGDYQARKNFLKFFREEMLNIREEMYEEFKEHITDTDFDLYFRAAISNYEGVR